MNFSKISELYDRHIVDGFNSGSDIVTELNSLLAEEFIAWYQYYVVIPFLSGPERESVANKFKELADDELEDHATKLINRLNELGYSCALTTPDTWKDYAKMKASTAELRVDAQLALNIAAEEAAINHYTEVYNLATSLGDIVTADLLKEILADEQNHLSELNDFMKDLKFNIN